MARNHGRILASVWADAEFRDLTPDAQRLYFFLISQPNLNHAGLLPMTLRRWAGAARGLTVADVRGSLAELDGARFVVVDEDTEEVLIRTLVRNDGIWKQPKVMLAMESAAGEIVSPALRAALVAELERLDLTVLSDEPSKSGESTRGVVHGVIGRLKEAFAEAARRVSERVSATLPGTSPEASMEPLGAPWSPLSGAPTPAGAPQSTFAAPHDDDQGKATGEEVSDTPATPDAKGIGKGIGNPHACAHARSPAPTPTPTPVPPSAGAVAPRAHAAPATADQLIADWLDHIPKRPPGQVIGQVGKHIKAMLTENIDPADIRRGIAAWVTKGLHPSTLPSVVNEVMNATPLADAAPRPSRNAQIAAGFAARVAAAEAAQHTRPDIRIVKGELFP